MDSPPEEGKRLSDALMATADVSWAELEIDARGLPPKPPDLGVLQRFFGERS
jgi:hypothetical protein